MDEKPTQKLGRPCFERTLQLISEACTSVVFVALLAECNAAVAAWVAFIWVATFAAFCVTGAAVAFMTCVARCNTAITTRFALGASFAA